MGSSSNYNVNLRFTADANAAKAEIKSLQAELNKIATGKLLPKDNLSTLTPEIQKAMAAAGELQAKLESAVNVNTGKLDLGKFSDSLKSSGKTLTQYAQQLNALGPEGQQAFTQLAQAVIKAETPIIRCSDHLKKLGVSIKNAASWQISSSVIHGFMGAVQSAYGYAEDLNESLNNIRIVTGQTAAQMDKFAATASKAAKALSATTLDYTNASLIYYQQGLTDQQVKERTDVTIKMANVAQQSATVVSDQMTAIWNNFYDGSKSLEYYADVLVKLGAATASSTDEIAGGLEKFAAIGNTIGLSYEYAASALATITSNTRQSEEVVGTALKTIFARIQDLELGETLDDGTSLGSYAQALKAVGVDVLDTAGEMRKMDDILDDLAERWGGLSSATKTATAQAVAGTRQYVQLVALMDNWNTNDADSMTANLGYTRNASGELEEQAKIYSESWEAARDRVTASLEAIYNKLISDDAFITILDGVSAVIDGVGTLIDSLGGLKGVIFTIGSIVTRLFKDEIAQGLRNAASNISSFIGLNRKAQQDLKDETLYVLSQKRSTSTGEQTREAENASYTHESDMQKWLAKNGSHLTEEQMKQVQLQMDLVRAMDQRAIAAAKIADEAEREEEALITQISLQKKMEEREKQRAARAAIDQKIQTAKDEGESGADYTKWKSDKQSSSLGKAFDLLKSQGLADDEDAKSWGKDRKKGYSDVIAGLNALEGTQGLPDDVVSQVAQIKAEINAAWGAGVDDYVQHLSKEKVDITIDEEKIAKDIGDARTTIEKAATAVVYSQDLDKTARNVGSFSGTTSNKGIVDQDIKTYIQLAGKVKDTKRALSAIDNPSADVKKDIAQAKEWHQALTKVVALGKKIESTDFDPESEEGKKLLDDYAAAVDAVNQNLVEMQESLRTSKTDMSDLPGVTDAVETLGGDPSAVTTVYNRVRAEREADNKSVDAKEPASYFDTNTQGLQDWSTALTSAGEAVMSVGAIVSSVQGAIDVFNDPDASDWDKFTSVITVAGTAVQAFTTIVEIATSKQAFLTLAILAIAAAAAGLIYWCSSITTEAEKAAKAQQQAADDANAAAEALNNARDSYEGLKQAIEDYTNAKNGLDTLIKGSKELSEGIADANEKARILMDTYGLMGTYNAETGLWEISKDEMSRVEEANKQKVRNADAANSAAQANLKNATNYNNMAQAASKTDGNGAEWAGGITGGVLGTAGAVGGAIGGVALGTTIGAAITAATAGTAAAAAGAAAGAAVGSVVPILGTAVGALAGIAIGIGVYAASNEAREEKNQQQIAALEKLSINFSNTNGDYNTAFNTLSEADQNLINQLGLTSDELAQLCLEVAANTAAIRQENKNVVDNYFQNNDSYANSNNKNALNNVLASEVAIKQKEQFEENYSKLKNDDLRQAYQDAFGYKGYKENGDGVSSYYDAKNNTWVDMSDDMARQALAQQAALQAVSGQIATFDSDLTTLNAENATASQKVMSVSAADGTFYDVDKDTLKSLIANGELTTENFNAETLGISEDTFEAIWRAAGYNDVGEYIDSLNAMSGDIDNVFNNIANKYTNSVTNALNSLDETGNYSANEFTAIGDALNNAYKSIGSSGVDNLTGVFKNAGEDADVLATALKGVDDWTDPHAIEDLNEALEKQGVDITALGPEWDSFCQSMVDASTNVYTLIDAFDGLRSTIASIKKITGELSFGDTISDEDYQTLLAYNKEIANLFTMTYDGWKFVGDENVLSSMLESSYDNISDIKSKFEQARKVADGLSGLNGWRNEDGTYTIGGDYMKTDAAKALALNTFLNQDGFGDSFDSLVDASGYSRESLSEAISTVANGTIAKDSEQYQQAMDIVDSFYNTSQQFIDNLENGMFEDSRAEEVWVNTMVDSIDELNQVYDTGKISLETYDKTLESVWQKQLNTYGLNEDTVQSYRDMLEAGQGLSQQSSMFLSEQLKDMSASKVDALLDDLSITIARLTKGLKTLGTNWKSWNKVMSNSESTIDQIAEILPDINDSIADILDWDTSDIQNLGADFYKANWPLIQDVYNGVDGAIEKLSGLATQEWVIQTGLLDNATPEAMAAYELLKQQLENMPDLEVGMMIDDTPLNEAFEAMLDSGYFTVDQLNSILSNLNFSPEVYEKEFDISEVTPPGSQKKVYTWEKDGIVYRVRADDYWSAKNTNGKVKVVGINSPPRYMSGGGARVQAPKAQSSSSGGGSSAKVEKMDYTKKSDVVERYKEVNDQLDNVADSMSKVQNIADKLWGKDHIKNLQSQNALLSQQIALLEEEYEEALAYQKEDAEAVRAAAEAMGLSAVVSLDEGRITNIEDIQEQMYNQLHAAEEHYNSLATKDEQDSYKETVLEPLEKRIEAFEDAVGLFENSSDTAMDAELKKQEARLEQMANNFTMWTENLDIPIELNEKDVEYIEWLISRLEDDVYEMAEKGALIIGSLSEGQIGGQMEKYLDNLELADASLKDLEASYAAGEITQADYIEGLDKISETYLDNIQNLDELDKTMQELYGETISAATEELARYTEQMEHSTSVLDHYKSVIELMGKSNDYEMIGKVLEGQAKTTKNQMEVSKQWYETMRTNADTAAAEYAAAQARGASEAELEILKQNWDEAETAANEAQEQMLSDAEAWAEKMKEVLENKLAGFGQTLENALTGGTSFDTMTGALERASSLQEEYLTTTNQIYETNKLMRQAQQEIDKTTNSVAKKRLAAYINETQQLQNQSKLSNYELEIQQAKYNLLLAEIALQEAQDAKSVVRLQRDSEGNLGYVYTADQDKIADAQQKLEDAQNSLYNIGLEGANGYVEKYSQLMSEMYDTITEIQSQYLEGAFESEEEYQNAIMEAKQYYYDKLKDYSSLYQIALTTDSRVVADAWSTDFADMTYNTAQWMDAIDIYVDQAAQAFKDWHNEVTGPDSLAGIGTDVDAVAASVESVVDKSDELAEITINTVIPALDDEMDSVQNLTGSYATLRDTIIEIIDKYGLMIDTINGKKRSYWEGGTDESGSGSGTGDANDSESTDTSSNDGTAGNAGNAAATKGLKVGDRVTVKGSVRQFSQKSGNQYMQEWVPGSEFEVFRIDGSQVLIGDRKRSGTYTGWVNRTDLEGFATGGYTGEWGSYGKLAMLHQKELVLNADDTKNFLASMELLDHILEVIDLQSASAQLGGLLTSPGVRDNNSTIEQNVHIEASFPNVQERSEIEEAFNNLINQASQYANRK